MHKSRLILALAIGAVVLTSCLPPEVLHQPHDADRMPDGTTIITDGGNWWVDSCDGSKVMAGNGTAYPTTVGRL